MDEQSLRELLDSTLIREPPIGPVARNSLRAGIRLRRRRRAGETAGAVALLTGIAVAIPAITGALGNTPAAPHAAHRPIAYVSDNSTDTVTPITTATNTAGKPIKVGRIAAEIAITPDGKTAYVDSQGDDTVTPITTATNTPGKPIKVGKAPYMIAITP